MCAIGSSSNTSVGGSASTSTLLGAQNATQTLTPGAKRAADGMRGTVLTGGSGMSDGPGAPAGGTAGGGRDPRGLYQPF